MIRVIGFDQGRKSNRIYDKGKVIAYSDTNKYPQSRIHTDAKSLLVIVVAQLLMILAIWLAFLPQEMEILMKLFQYP